MKIGSRAPHLVVPMMSALGLFLVPAANAAVATFQANCNTSITDSSLNPSAHNIQNSDIRSGPPAALTPISFDASDSFGGGTATATTFAQPGLMKIKCSAGYAYVIRSQTTGGQASGNGMVDESDFVTVGSPTLPSGTVVQINFGMLLDGTASPPWSDQLRPGIAAYMFANMRAFGAIGDRILNITVPQVDLHDLRSSILAKVGETFSFRYSMQVTCTLVSDIPDIRFVSCDFYGSARPFMNSQNPNVTLVSASGFDYTGVALPCRADLNGDNAVDDADFVLFAAAYNILDCADPGMPAGCPADLNGDGFVDDADFVLFAAAYNELLCP